MKSSIRTTQPEKHQAGAATLLMATVLLMAVSMIGVYSTRSGVVEQRVAANAIWSQQALDAGQAALDNILAVEKKTLQGLALGASTFQLSNDPANKTAKSGADIITVSQNTLYTATLTSTDSFDTASVTVKVKGPGGVAEKSITQKARFGPFVKNIPDTVTAGGPTPDIPPDTIVPKPNPTNKPKPSGCPKKAAMLAKANINTAPPSNPAAAQPVKLTIPAADALTPDEMDAFVFSDSPAHLRGNATLYLDCTAKACTKNDIPNKQSGLIWVDGSLNLSGNAEIGDGGTAAIDRTDSKPAILVVSYKDLPNGTRVNANLSIKNATINGLVYVRGDWNNGNGNGTINGAMMATGNLTLTGSLVANEEPWLMDNLKIYGSYARVAGTWADF